MSVGSAETVLVAGSGDMVVVGFMATGSVAISGGVVCCGGCRFLCCDHSSCTGDCRLKNRQ